MTGIGGYFELELPPIRKFFVHSEGVMVNSGRHALEYILRSINDKILKIWLPFYTCEVILQPIKKMNLEFEFYHINDSLEISNYPNLRDGEYIVVNNYFGIKDRYIQDIVAPRYGNRLIIDNAQAWYAHDNCVKYKIYSPRKFFGMPDGGIAITPDTLNINLEKSESYNKTRYLLKRIDLGPEAGYEDFRETSRMIGNESLSFMSNLSLRILSSIDFEAAKERRWRNFAILHEALRDSNKLSIPEFDSFECPMVYPYLTNKSYLRNKLIKNRIFVATYWPNVFDWCLPSSTEYFLAQNLLPLPVDQRYGMEEMNKIIEIINNQ